MKAPTRFERSLRRHARAVRIGVIAYAVAAGALMVYALISDAAKPIFTISPIVNSFLIIVLYKARTRPGHDDPDGGNEQ